MELPGHTGELLDATGALHPETSTVELVYPDRGHTLLPPGSLTLSKVYPETLPVPKIYALVIYNMIAVEVYAIGCCSNPELELSTVSPC